MVKIVKLASAWLSKRVTGFSFHRQRIVRLKGMIYGGARAV